jgi:hypothetical protein
VPTEKFVPMEEFMPTDKFAPSQRLAFWCLGTKLVPWAYIGANCNIGSKVAPSLSLKNCPRPPANKNPQKFLKWAYLSWPAVEKL